MDHILARPSHSELWQVGQGDFFDVGGRPILPRQTRGMQLYKSVDLRGARRWRPYELRGYAQGS